MRESALARLLDCLKREKEKLIESLLSFYESWADSTTAATAAVLGVMNVVQAAFLRTTVTGSLPRRRKIKRMQYLSLFSLLKDLD